MPEGGAMFSAMAGLIGILLGGGMKAAEAWWTRKKDAEGVLSAIVSEVQALTRLINHRQFMAGLIAMKEEAQRHIDTGKPDEIMFPFKISTQNDFFRAFDSLSPKLGLLTPWQADRITRFYAYVKAVHENYKLGSPFHDGATASTVVLTAENDIQLLQTAMVISDQIVRMITVQPPPGVEDPFPIVASEPSLPAPNSEEISKASAQIESA